MHIVLDPKPLEAVSANVLFIPTGRSWREGAVARLDRRLRGRLTTELQHQCFSGKAGEVALFQTHGTLPARYVVAVGTSDDGGAAVWYQIAHTAVTRARELNAGRAAIALAATDSPQLETLVEGLRLSAYSFDKMKGAAKAPESSLSEVRVLTETGAAAARRALRRGETIAAATCYARDLINLPAAIVTPTYLKKEAQQLARRQRLRARILSGPALQRAGMGALLGVAKGSAQPPCFIEMHYKPTGARRRSIALVGKGITFDSGGLSLKPAQSMESQKRDMAGGAAVLAVMSVVRDLAIDLEVRGYIPCTENMPGDRALKPGDVLRAYNGKTIEVLNTDAEGRLVLADALAYAASQSPDAMIDLATLTAAVRTALGTRYAAIMGTDPTLVQAVIAAGTACGEHFWELPLVDEYRHDIDSTVADLKNTGDGHASTIIGGLFLREFAGGRPWAHIDFSSTVMADKPFACHPHGATGFGVRTLLRYLASA